MKYCVLIKISKHQLAFWYQLEGGAFAPLSFNGPIKIPLCFYVNGSDFKIGEFARERFLVNDKNAYNNYFDLVKDPSKHFVIHGDSKPLKQLLYYGVENYLSRFIKEILFKNDSIEAYRTDFCLRLWFDDDIESQEKLFVENIFKEAGYYNVAQVDSDSFLNLEISSETQTSKARLCLSTISNNLFIKLYNSPNFSLVDQILLEQLGSDPRAEILARLILEDIKEVSPHIYIDEEKEVAHIINHCAQLLSSLSPIMRNEVELSNGEVADYKIRLAHLEDRLIYNRGVEDKVIPQLESLLVINGLLSSFVDIFLIGDELNTSYFREKLTKKFPNVFGFDSSIESKILRFIFADISSNGYELKQNSLCGHGESKEEIVPISRMSSALKAPRIGNTPPVVRTPPMVTVPPVVMVPPFVKKNNSSIAEVKREKNGPPIINPEVRVPPVIKEAKKVNTPLPPPLKGKIPPLPSPPIKRK